jgi:predicted GNAT superfamily acetyltransferase
MNSCSASIVIRDIESFSEMRAVEQLQRDIWGVTDRDVFPALALIPIKEVGGILIGAFADNKLIGFAFGFPGVANGRPFIHSDMLGVTKTYRSLGLGCLLKLEQRKRALSMGIDRITWTFDPLQSINAHLNFARLGVIADRYEVDFYGETSSHLHRSGTDRLWVTWWLESSRVVERLNGPQAELPPLPRDAQTLLRLDEDGQPILARSEDFENVLIEVPGPNYFTTGNEERVRVWREATRRAFTSALEAGYIVEEFLRQAEKGVYVLQRRLQAPAKAV